MQSLKDLTLMVSKKRPMLKVFFLFFFLNKEICQLFPLIVCESYKKGLKF